MGFCPGCFTREANSKHHIKPRSQGGTDDNRNTRLLCKECHDVVEEMQEEAGLELCPELLRQLHEKLHTKLEVSKKDGVEISWLHGNFLSWACLPGQTKVWVNQWIGYEPIKEDKLIRKDKIEEKQLGPKKRRAFPGKPEIHTSYLEELIYNKGLSYRAAHRQLELEGFKISHEAIRKRVRNSPAYIPPVRAECKHCRKLFTPEHEKQSYCSPECDSAHRRDYDYLERVKERLRLKANLERSKAKYAI